MAEVALIGKGPSRKLAPLKGENGVVTWGINDLVGQRECDVCFFMDKDLVVDCKLQDMDEVVTKSVNKTGTPMYSVRFFSEVPTSIAYPLDEVKAMFNTDFFADSGAYMIALAIYQGFDTISLYGMEYSWGGHYEKERECIMFWLGIALGRGIKVNVHGHESTLFYTRDKNLYAYLTPQDDRKDSIYITEVITEDTEIMLSVEDRVAIGAILPMQADFITMRFIKSLVERIKFTLEETKVLNFREVSGMKVWDDHNLPEIPITLSPTEKATMQSWLAGLDRRKLITRSNYGLYEKFFAKG